MNLLRVSSIDKYEDQLLGYCIIGNKIFYLTQKQFCMIRVSKFKKDTIKMKGKNITNFVISKRGYIAFLYKTKSIEIRRLDQLNEVWHKFNNILIIEELNYPKMVWDYEQLYLIYPESLEIFTMQDKSRKGYTDIVTGYLNEKITNILISNVMDTERAAILQLTNRLIFTIIPIPISELCIKNINSTISLYSPSHLNDSRKEFLAVLAENSILKIYNFLNLKQIFEVNLGSKQNQFLQMQADPNHQCILIRYLDYQTMEIKKNVIYKINSEVYYKINSDFFFDSLPFFNYSCEVPIKQNLTLFPLNIQPIEGQIFDSYHISFFKNGQLYIAYQLIPNKYSQSLKQMKADISKKQWHEMTQWKQIMSTYLQIPLHLYPVNKNQPRLRMRQEQRQLSQYSIIKKEFDHIMAKFTEKMNEQSKRRVMNEKNIQEQWDVYMAQIARQRNFLIQTMQLFKIEASIMRQRIDQKIIKENNQLQQCVQELSSRETRIDAKIQQKRKELQNQRKEIPKVTPEEIQKYEEEYIKFVTEFLAETERKERQQQQNKKRKNMQNYHSDKIVLALPKLTQQQKKIINFQSQLKQNNNQALLSLKKQENEDIQLQNQKQSERNIIFQTIYMGLSPLEEGLQQLSQSITKLQEQSLKDLQQNQQKLNSQCKEDIQKLVRKGFKKMFQGLNLNIKRQTQSATHKIYKLQQKNIQFYDQLIQKYREFIKFQIEHKIDVFYKSRKQLQSSLNMMVKGKITQHK